VPSSLAVQFLCPACQTPLPRLSGGAASLHCPACLVEVDAARLETLVGKPRFVAERSWSGVELDGILVDEVIGAGGMGTVYRARSLADDQPLAVKFLSPSLAAEPELVARFSREVALLEKLDHVGIVKVKAHGEAQGVPWFAMDLVEGPTLAARLAKGPLGLAEARTIFSGLLDALVHAHARGVVHRDLKPANVLLAADGPRLADFGIARLDFQANTGKTQLTRTAAILGTFPYMSPEQRAGRTVDARSDLYSVGVMLYEALAGQRPEGAFPPLHRLRAEVPSRLDQLLLHLLQPDPGQRVASAVEAKRGLAGACARPSRKPLAWAGAGVAASALAVALLLLARDKPAAKDVAVPPPPVTPSPVSKVASPGVAEPKVTAEVPAPVPQAMPEKPTPKPPELDIDFLTSKPSRMKSPKRSTGKGNNVDRGKLKALMDDKVDKNEPFLDSNNARPVLLQQAPTQASSQTIPLLKSSPQPQSGSAKNSPTQAPATKAMPSKKAWSKGGGAKDFRSDDFGSVQK
jgi:serine/threonine protein kinase